MIIRFRASIGLASAFLLALGPASAQERRFQPFLEVSGGLPVNGSAANFGGIQDFQHRPLGGVTLIASFGVDYIVEEPVALYAKVQVGVVNRGVGTVINVAPGPTQGQSVPFAGSATTIFGGLGAGVTVRQLPNPFSGFGRPGVDRTAEFQLGGGVGYGRTQLTGGAFTSTGSGFVYWGETAYRMQVTNRLMVGPAVTLIGGSVGQGNVRPATSLLATVRGTLGF